MASEELRERLKEILRSYAVPEEALDQYSETVGSLIERLVDRDREIQSWEAPPPRPLRLAHYPCGCVRLAPGETSTVEFEMRLPKCEAFRTGAKKSLGQPWHRFYDAHFRNQPFEERREGE